jgi:hypothetical protein
MGNLKGRDDLEFLNIFGWKILKWVYKKRRSGLD